MRLRIGIYSHDACIYLWWSHVDILMNVVSVYCKNMRVALTNFSYISCNVHG